MYTHTENTHNSKSFVCSITNSVWFPPGLAPAESSPVPKKTELLFIGEIMCAASMCLMLLFILLLLLLLLLLSLLLLSLLHLFEL